CALLHRPPYSILFPYTTLFRSVCADWHPALVLDVRSGAIAVESAATDAAAHLPDVPARVITGRVELGRVRHLHAESFTGDVRAQIGRAHVELQSRENLVCRLLL